MAHITHTITVKKKDGTEAEHTAEAVRVIPQADGAVTIAAMCCGDERTLSHHSFYDVANMDDDAVLREVQEHVEKVARCVVSTGCSDRDRNG
jgi:uncharacterized hydantoinase/oxoprolinase family protein